MSFRCLGDYPLYKFYLSKVEAINLLSQAPLQLVLRLWPHDEDAPLVNSDSGKHDMNMEVPRGISNIESDRETSSCWIKQWQRHLAH